MNNNVIQIKRGEGHPGNVLQPYEPGIDITDDNHFYIGGPLMYSDSDDGNTSNPSARTVIKETSEAQEVKVGLAMGLVLDPKNFGLNFPANPKEGQVFFQLLTE